MSTSRPFRKTTPGRADKIQRVLRGTVHKTAAVGVLVALGAAAAATVLFVGALAPPQDVPSVEVRSAPQEEGLPETPSGEASEETAEVPVPEPATSGTFVEEVTPDVADAEGGLDVALAAPDVQVDASAAGVDLSVPSVGGAPSVNVNGSLPGGVAPDVLTEPVLPEVTMTGGLVVPWTEVDHNVAGADIPLPSGTVEIPGPELPPISAPGVDLDNPQIEAPELGLPGLGDSDIDLGIPGVEEPDLGLPNVIDLDDLDLGVPGIDTPDLGSPDLGDIDVSLAALGAEDLIDGSVEALGVQVDVPDLDVTVVEDPHVELGDETDEVRDLLEAESSDLEAVEALDPELPGEATSGEMEGSSTNTEPSENLPQVGVEEIVGLPPKEDTEAVVTEIETTLGL